MTPTPKEIRDRITMTIACSAPEALSIVKGKIRGYVTMLKEMLLECPTCFKSMGAHCPACVKIDEMIGWSLEKLQEIEKKT